MFKSLLNHQLVLLLPYPLLVGESPRLNVKPDNNSPKLRSNRATFLVLFGSNLNLTTAKNNQ